jgi:transposase InsO family protein
LKNDELFFEGNYHCNIPVLSLETTTHKLHLCSAEILHKALGHVSYQRIRNKLGIPIKAPKACKLCAVVKITKSLFKKRSSIASKPFKEIHLDLIGPILPMLQRKHRFILTIVDSNTRYVSAIPLVSKGDVFSALTRLLDVEAKRIGYHPSVLHSDRGTEFTNSALSEYCSTHIIRQHFSNAYTPQQNSLAERFNRTILELLKTIILDSGIRQNLWNKILSACTLTLNQIPTHRSNKSPYKLFKNTSIPLNFFHPIRNPVAVLSLHKKKAKLEPQGELGKLIGFNPEMKSYQILKEEGSIINSKSVTFLNYIPCQGISDSYDELLIEEKTEAP